MRMIFVNLPVKDLKASMGFFTELGFEFNPKFSDDQAACMVVDENIFVMLLVEDRFKDFINGEIADAPRATEAITAISPTARRASTRLSRRPSPPAASAGSRRWKTARCTPEASRTWTVTCGS